VIPVRCNGSGEGGLIFRAVTGLPFGVFKCQISQSWTFLNCLQDIKLVPFYPFSAFFNVEENSIFYASI